MTKNKKITDFDAIQEAIDKPTNVKPGRKVTQEPVGDKLSARQKRFVELYTGDLLGNWVQCYLEVYDIDQSKPNWYKTACVCSSKLLRNAKVYDAINLMLEEAGLNDNFVDKQLLFLMSQQDDFSAKLGAMKVYNDLKARAEKGRLRAIKEATSEQENETNRMTDDDLIKLAYGDNQVGS